MDRRSDGFGEQDEPRFGHDFETGRGMIEAAFAEDEEKRQQVTLVFCRALGDLTLF